VICEAFTCTPEEAVRQDWPTVQAILDYRTARLAVDLFNEHDAGAKQLQAQPALLAALQTLSLANTDALTLAEAERLGPLDDPMFALDTTEEDD
jgi:hypothetical protein